MAMGQQVDVEEAIGQILQQEQNGVKLPAAVLMATLNYLIDEVKVGSLDELPVDVPAEMLEIFAEAWKNENGKDMPAMVARRAKKWLGLAGAGLAPLSNALDLAHGGEASAAIPSKPLTSAALGDTMSGTTTADPEGLMAGVMVSSHDMVRAVQDATKQRISGMRILALSVALEVGRCVPLGSVSAMVYGSNARLFDLVKQSRKAGVDTLGSIISEKSKVKIGTHFTSLMSDYMTRGMAEEASIISSFWVEAQQNFDADWDALFEYLDAYFKTFSGRGLPVNFDMNIAWRIRSASGGKSVVKETEAMKEVKAKANSAESEMRKLKTALEDQKKMISDLKAQVRTSKISEANVENVATGRRPFNGRCDNCGKVGHRKFECPELAQSKEDP